jgi:phospholipid/cholesterol/gamma-HCH transport system substrate-binding protein
MKFKIRFADQIVGIFVLLAIIAIAAILIFVGINQRWFARNYDFTSRFDSAGGLSVGMPIMLKGFEIGKVSRIALNEENQVDIEFSVQDTYYDKVLPNSVLELTSSPIGLGVSLKFHPGLSAGPRVEEGSFIPSLDLPEGRRLVEEGLVAIPKGEDVIGSVIAKVNPILEEVRTTLTQIKKLVSTVDSALAGKGGPVGEAITGLAATPVKVNRVIDDVGSKVGDLMGTVSDIAGRVNSVLDKIDAVSVDLGEISQTTKGTLATLSTNLESITENLKVTSEGLKDTRGLATRLLDPKGSLDTILNDQNALYKQVDSALQSTNAVITQLKGFVEYINSTRPQISSILEKGRETLDQGKDVLEAVKNNPLLKGGVPAQKEQTSTLKSYRDEDF